MFFSSCYAALRFTNHFPKQKPEKRKQWYNAGTAETPKGNGISPEGWKGKMRLAKPPFFLSHYAGNLLVFH